MAEVWEAHDENLDRDVAVKMLHGHLAGDAGFVSRFRREALSIAKLSHPNVVAIFDTGVDQVPGPTGAPTTTRAYIVMELIRGESLRALLQKGLTMPKAVDIVRQAADGLAYAHRNGLIHRDVKPANILVQADGRVKVVDFGIAKLTDRRVDDHDVGAWAIQNAQAGEDLTQVGAILGTAKYLAPEQVEGGEIDARSDIYALGVVLYESVCGRPPFAGKNDITTALKHVRETAAPPRQVKAGVPRSLEAAITKAMARRPSERFATADDLAAALRTIDLRPDDAQPNVGRTERDITPPKPFVRPPGIGPSVGAPAFGRTSSPPPANPVDPTGQIRVPAKTSVVTGARPGNGTTDPTTVQRNSSTPAKPLGRRLFVLAVAGLVLGVGAGVAASSVLKAVRSTTALQIDGASAYDPLGDGSEKDAAAKNAVDGDMATSWTTEGYGTRKFNDTKDGVGIIVRLREASEVSELRVASPSRQWSAKVYIADKIPLSFADWGPALGRLNNVGTSTTNVKLTKKRGSLVLLWITELGPKADGQQLTRVIIQELTPRR